MRILSVAAHPDDVEITCAGTLALAAKSGHDVTVAHFTSGDKGGERNDDRARMRRIRWDEAQASADVIGARHVGGWLDDVEIYPNGSAAQSIRELIADEVPELVLLPPPNDYHADHRQASHAAMEAICRVQLDRRGAYSPDVFYTDTLGSLEFVPDAYVDISAVMNVKDEMLRKHESQIRWMGAHRGLDMFSMMRACAWYRGMQADVAFAEGFRSVVTDPTGQWMADRRGKKLAELIGAIA